MITSWYGESRLVRASSSGEKPVQKLGRRGLPDCETKIS